MWSVIGSLMEIGGMGKRIILLFSHTEIEESFSNVTVLK